MGLISQWPTGQLIHVAAGVEKIVRQECVAHLTGRVSQSAAVDCLLIRGSYCGSSDEYCGTGCQASFGKCLAASKPKRAYRYDSRRILRQF